MNKNLIVFPFAAIIALFMVSCKCNETCSAFDPEELTYIPYEQGNEIRYTNGAGTSIIFRVNSKTVSEEKKADTKMNEFGGCTVNGPCSSTATLSATGNTSRGTSSKLEINLSEGEDGAQPGNFLSTVTLLDYSGMFFIKNGLAPTGNDSISTHETLGNHQYANVLVSTIDTLTSPAQAIWQVYISKDGGIAGFRDRQTHSLFYLE